MQKPDPDAAEYSADQLAGIAGKMRGLQSPDRVSIFRGRASNSSTFSRGVDRFSADRSSANVGADGADGFDHFY